MNVSRPLCVVCNAEEREPRSSRCWDCGPGRITPNVPTTPTPERTPE